MFIKSPLSYPGNKYQLLDEIYKYIDDSEVIFDLFCGSSVVGINVKNDRVYLNDNNTFLIYLLNYLVNNMFEKILLDIEQIIEKYNLTNSFKNTYKYYKNLIKEYNNTGLKSLNEKGFYNLRDDFNNQKNKFSKKSIIMLFVLKIYSFNNEIRFNKLGHFNIPVGKTDFNLSTFKKIKIFKNRIDNKKLIISNYNYDDQNLEKFFLKATLFYLDPPYFLTNATYNINWNLNEEKKFYNFIKEKLINKNRKFILSNILKRNNVENKLLKEFICKNNLKMIEIKKNYVSSSYNKKNRYQVDVEVLVMNFEI